MKIDSTARNQMFKTFQDADKAFRVGDHITDEQLNVLVIHYRRAYNALRAIYNPQYKLVETDIYQRMTQLEGFQKARAEKHVSV